MSLHSRSRFLALKRNTEETPLNTPSVNIYFTPLHPCVSLFVWRTVIRRKYVCHILKEKAYVLVWSKYSFPFVTISASLYTTRKDWTPFFCFFTILCQHWVNYLLNTDKLQVSFQNVKIVYFPFFPLLLLVRNLIPHPPKFTGIQVEYTLTLI